MKNFLIMIMTIMTLAGCGGAEERKAVYLEKAKLSLDAGDLDKARIELKNVLQIDPKDAQAHFQLGKIFEQKEEYKKAYKRFLTASELDPDNLEYHATIGTYLLMLSGAIDLAIEKRDLILSKDPSNVSGLLLSANILVKQNDAVGAKKITQGIFLKHPGNTQNAILLSLLYFGENNYKESISVLKSCINENPDNVVLITNLANRYVRMNELDLAEIEFKKILEINPEEFINYVSLATLYKKKGDQNKAENILRKAVEKNIDQVDRVFALIEVVQQARGNKVAIEELEKFIVDNENKGKFQLRLAKLYVDENDLVTAEKILKSVISDHSEDMVGVQSRNFLASIYMKKKDVKAASRIIDDALTVSPNNSESNFFRAKLYFIDKKYDETISSIRIVLKDDPEDIEAYFLLSDAHRRKGQDVLADEILAQGYEKNRTNGKALIALAKYYAASKNDTELEKVVNSYLSIDIDNYEILSLKSAQLNKEKQFIDAFQFASRMLKLHPDMPNGYIQSAPYMLAENKNDEIISLLEEGYKKVKNNGRILELLVSIYVEQKNYDSAINKVKSAISDYGGMPRLYMLLSKIQMASGDGINAKISLNKIIDIMPDWKAPYLHLANIYATERQEKKEEDVLKQGLEMLEGDLELTFRLAKIYESQGDYDQAISIYSKAYANYPNNAILINNLAVLLSERNNDEASLSRAKELADRLKLIENVVFLDTVGWVYYQIGNHAEALDILKRVVEKSPDEALFNYHFGMVLFENGDATAAKTYLSRSLANNGSFRGKGQAEALLRKLQ